MKRVIVNIVCIYVLAFAAYATDLVCPTSEMDQDHSKASLSDQIVDASRQWIPIAPADDRVTHGTINDNDNDMLYMVGGTPNGQSGSNLPVIYAYDPNLDAWNMGLNPMPDARGWIQGAYWNGTIYVLCGYTNSASGTNSNFQYDIASDSWSSGPNCPRSTLAHGTVCWNGNIYLVGGLNVSMTGGTTAVNRFGSGGWTTCTPLPREFDMGGVCIWDNVIYVLGGYDRGAGQTWANVLEGVINISTPDTITWTWLDPLPVPVGINAATALNGTAYLLGGFENLSVITSHFWQYEPMTGVWTQLSDYPVGICRGNLLIARRGSDEVYALAGDANGDWSPPNNYYNKHQNLGVVESRERAANIDAFYLFPSIGKGKTTISFTLTAPNQVSLDLYNAAGQRAESILNDHGMLVGQHKIDMSLTELPAGVYFVTLKTGQGAATEKLVVTK